MSSIISNKQYITIYKAALIGQYFKIMQALDANQSAPSEVMSEVTSLSEVDSLQCDEKSVQYTHWCDDCENPTTYYKKPPTDYPFQLCLSDECITAFLQDEYDDKYQINSQ